MSSKPSMLNRSFNIIYVFVHFTFNLTRVCIEKWVRKAQFSIPIECELHEARNDMKKFITILVILFLLFGAGFMFLLSKTSPDNAPSEIKTIDLSDDFRP